MKSFLFFAFFFILAGLNAQTWSDNVASIMYSKCATCHHDGGIAPFSLMTYGVRQVQCQAPFIKQFQIM